MNIKFLKERLMDLRQLTYPAAFRIHEREGSDALQLAVILEELQLLAKNASLTGPGKREVNAIDDESFMVDLSIRLWRIKDKLVDKDCGEPYSGSERAFRHVERLIVEIKNKGIRTEDRTGDHYDSGMLVQVIAAEPVEGIDRKIIKETVEPAVYRDDRLIHHAHIIVGTPLESDQGNSNSDRTLKDG